MNRDEGYEAREKALNLIAEIRLGLPPKLAMEYLIRIRNMAMTAIEDCTAQIHKEKSVNAVLGNPGKSRRQSGN